MPILLPDGLPARDVLKAEDIRLLAPGERSRQDVPPLEIALLNLMPEKIKTENQLARMLGASPFDVRLTLLATGSYQGRNTAPEHIARFYRTWEQVRGRRFGGLIITGAPVETKPFEEVDYWPELVSVMDWSVEHAGSTLGLCWGAQSMLWRFHGVPKFTLPSKMFGVFRHRVVGSDPILGGIAGEVLIPASRHTDTRAEDVAKVPALKVLLDAEESGLCLIAEPARRRYYMFNHFEYDATTLDDEYRRDLTRGDAIALPKYYFESDDPTRAPLNRWGAHGRLFYGNWLAEVAKSR
jgi:homoserine O-succinyltransferase/O-acetyltransferase